MKTVLIIDDDEFDRRMIKYALNRQGTKCVFYEANNGREGCAMAREIQPDITLLDLRMPYMDGFQTLNCIRKSDQCKHSKVFMLTGSDDEGEHKLALENGADNFITKPSDLEGYQSIASNIEAEMTA